MNQIYSKRTFNVYRVADGYIVHNTGKEFSEGHTHLDSFKSAKYLIDLAIHKSIPHHLDRYRLMSLVRISEDAGYQMKIMELVTNKKNKTSYVNRGRMCG